MAKIKGWLPKVTGGEASWVQLPEQGSHRHQSLRQPVEFAPNPTYMKPLWAIVTWFSRYAMVAGGAGRETQVLGVVHGLVPRVTGTRLEMRKETVPPQPVLLTVARTS